MHDVVTSPPSDHRTDQQRRILAAAATCFARSGFHGTSMQQICTEAGMSPGALYRYFPSKESLIGAIVESERTERAQLFQQVFNAPSFLDGLAAGLVTILTEDTLLCAKLGPEIMVESIRNARLRDEVEPMEAETRDMLRSAITAAAAEGQIDSTADPDDLMVLLQAIGDGLLLYSQLHPEAKIADRIPAFSTLVGRMLKPESGPGEHTP
ncbi:TetR/AcrR family transcriptional regulator [Aquabacter sp. L1I39]|uniref:TetR/AcrR family transcriptional regulator n=1 Tax=Aquabacter sp. L1I39 TaxID=2820278 RepID=UPI001ADC376C|nr:TetR/AcrR family transcriptional regulator [Aquabacter sp. L1I39]QTL04837.1 TetR/AcrR family transcriptional regulator [Aquabacter sp. L1I39]